MKEICRTIVITDAKMKPNTVGTLKNGKTAVNNFAKLAPKKAGRVDQKACRSQKGCTTLQSAPLLL